MENDKLEGSEIVGVVSQHAGALVGAAVAAGKRLGLHIRQTLAPEKGPS